MSDLSYQFVSFGDTESSIFAAIRAKLSGLSRVGLFIEHENLRNYSAAGLGRADIGKTRGIGGLQKVFAKRTGNMYGMALSYPFECSAIELLFWRWLGEVGVDVYRSARIDSVQMTGTEITQVTLEGGTTVAAEVFNDGTLFLDLGRQFLPRVDIEDAVDGGASGWTIGTESAAAYGESMAGFKRFTFTQSNVITKDGEGNLLTGVTADPGWAVGSAYDGVPCPGVRTLVTDDSNRLFPFDRIIEDMTYPYDKEAVQFAASFVGRTGEFAPAPVARGTYDLNSIITMTDPDTGRPIHWDVPTMSYAERDVAREKLLNHMRSRLYFTSQEEDFSGSYQDSQNQYGTPRTEYIASTRYTTQEVYWRGGVRLRGAYVMTEMDCRITDTGAVRHYLKPDAAALGVYSMDIKPKFFLTVAGDDTVIIKEGDAGGFDQTPNRVVAPDGYQIPIRALLPDAAQCTNMTVSYASSCTDTAWGSMRITSGTIPQGEACGAMAALSILNNVSLHSFATTNYAVFTAEMDKTGAKLIPVPVDPDGEDEDEEDMPPSPPPE